MEHLEVCSIGLYLQTETDCHKTTYTQNCAIKMGLKNVEDLQPDLLDLLKWRVGPEYTVSSSDTLCLHHEKCLLDKFSHLQTTCCDPYQRHKSSIKKALHVVDSAMSDQLSAAGLHVKPGFKLCRNCLKSITAEPEPEDDDPDFTAPADQLQTSLSSSLMMFGCSPLKISKYPKGQRSSYVVRKMKKLEAAVVSAVSSDAEPMLTSTLQSDCIGCKDLDILTSQLKEKCVLASKQQKIQLLTFAPPSWSIEKTVQEFGVTEYLVRQARQLKQTAGLLSTPELQQGKSLSTDIIKLVIDFYQDDEFSRLCPGKKEYVSVKIDGIKQHMQKRLLLGNLKELYLIFKEKNQSVISSANPNSKSIKSVISFSKFCELRPKWCILAGVSGSHSVCVCTIHQNVKLMLSKVGKEISYHQCLDKIVCSSSNKVCMIHRCDKCPGTAPLENFLEEQLAQDNDQDDLITFNQWVTTDRTTLVMHQMTVEDFISELVTKLDKLTVHEFVSKHQSRYLTELKSSISSNECIILLDFAENYSFVVQDAAQGFHWDNTQATLHPFVVYFRENNELKWFSFCCISNHMKHDVVTVHVFQAKVIEQLKTKIPGITKVYYFSDGCAGQYKNLKNFANLCFHEEDYSLSAEWNFFATSHGKSACDGIGGTVKRLAAKASLQRPLDKQILTQYDLYTWCVQNIENINFIFVDTTEVVEASNEQEKRFSLAKPVPGTRSFHWFVPLSKTQLQVGYISKDISRTFGSNQSSACDLHLQPGQFVACVYDGDWWLANIIDICPNNSDAKVTFMHPNGPALSFFWPHREDVCWVPTDHILCPISAPSTAGSGRLYTLDNVDQGLISRYWISFNVNR